MSESPAADLNKFRGGSDRPEKCWSGAARRADLDIFRDGWGGGREGQVPARRATTGANESSSLALIVT